MEQEIPTQLIPFSLIPKGSWFFIFENRSDTHYGSYLYKKATDLEMQHRDFVSNEANCFTFECAGVDGDEITGCLSLSEVFDDTLCQILTEDFGKQMLSTIASESARLLGQPSLADIVLGDVINFINTNGGDWSAEIEVGQSILLPN